MTCNYISYLIKKNKIFKYLILLFPRIKKISFKWDYLKGILDGITDEEVKTMFTDYINMVQHIKESDLCFSKVACSNKTVFLIDCNLFYSIITQKKQA